MFSKFIILLLISLALCTGASKSAVAFDDFESQLQLEIEESCVEPVYDDEDVVVFVSAVDCTVTTETGYSHGEPFDIDVVHVDDKAVEVATANAFLVMQEAADADGVGLGLVSGFRSYAEQEYLYNCYINCNCNNCNLAARPGYSNHNSGHALDLNASSPGVYEWLAANAATFGFERTVPSENWHWEWWGGGVGGGVCGIRECPSIPKDGRIVEETDACFFGGGQREFLREVLEGHGGTLLWTKATASETPSNYGIWTLRFAVPGQYEVQAFTDNGEYGQSSQAAYTVVDSAGEHTVTLNQSSADGWLSLGVFDFSTEGEFYVRLNDNTGEAWAADPGGVRLMMDALRVRPEGVDDGSDDTSGDGDGSDDDAPDDRGGLVGGCSTGGGASSSLWLALLALFLMVRRRRTLPSIEE